MRVGEGLEGIPGDVVNEDREQGKAAPEIDGVGLAQCRSRNAPSRCALYSASMRQGPPRLNSLNWPPANTKAKPVRAPRRFPQLIAAGRGWLARAGAHPRSPKLHRHQK